MLGSDEKVYVFALVATLGMPHYKYHHVMDKRTGIIPNMVTPLVTDMPVCVP